MGQPLSFNSCSLICKYYLLILLPIIATRAYGGHSKKLPRLCLYQSEPECWPVRALKWNFLPDVPSTSMFQLCGVTAVTKQIHFALHVSLR